MSSPAPSIAEIGELAATAGIGRVHMVAWRDLDDHEAGGSEIHAHEVARRWAAGGVDVTLRTSVVIGEPKRIERAGYRVVRKTGRYLVFARSALSGFVGRDGARDAVVEIWNGMPFLSPLWARAPRIVFLHHVHDEMWDMVIRPQALARAGRAMEFRVAPPLYRDVPIVTLSESSKREIVELLGLPARNITVVPPGIDPRFTPGDDARHEKAAHPLVVAVGRLVPVKRFHVLVDALARLKPRYPGLEAVIVGDGYERTMLEHRIRERGGHGWIHLPGRLEDDELISLYRKAWVLASSSAREGWGMTITEAAACGTPAVVTRIGGHEDAVVDDETGLLADDLDGLVRNLDLVLGDDAERTRLTKGALDRASRLTWEATARDTFRVLADEAVRWHARHG